MTARPGIRARIAGWLFAHWLALLGAGHADPWSVELWQRHFANQRGW
jgi:hypothetical protein